MHELLNSLVSNDYIRMVLFLITGVFMGYTLQPVPEWINTLFKDSQVFKAIILLTIGIIAGYPLESTGKLLVIVIGVVVTLFLFEYARKYKPTVDVDVNLQDVRPVDKSSM